jgi:predicted AAA+ superfamily ATPase
MLCYLGPERPEPRRRRLAVHHGTAVRRKSSRLTHRGIDPQVYFWRTSTGTEVDFVLETGGKLVPVEVKLSSTPRPAMASSIKTFREDFGARALSGYVVHPGEVKLPLGPGVTAWPYSQL